MIEPKIVKLSEEDIAAAIFQQEMALQAFHAGLDPDVVLQIFESATNPKNVDGNKGSITTIEHTGTPLQNAVTVTRMIKLPEDTED